MLNSLNWLPSWQLAAEKQEASQVRGLAGSTEDEGLTAEEEDKIAAQLLSQFPPFGSHEPKDWLSLGYSPSFVEDDDMFDGGAAGQEDGGLPDSSVLIPAHKQSATKEDASSSRTNKLSGKEDWDDDEQILWKKTELSAIKSQHSNINSARHLERPSKQTDWVTRGRSTKAHERTVPGLQCAHISSSVTHPKQNKPQDKSEESSSPVNHRDSTLSNRYFSLRTSAVAEAQSQSENRQHWMPDKLCKQCYSCETAFTVFRRRHHCRLCGQVFCNQCSAYFVPHKAGATVRVCQMCHEQVTERGGLIEDSNDCQKNNYDYGSAVSAGVLVPFKPSESTDTARPSIVGTEFDDRTEVSSRSNSLRDIETVLQRLSDSTIDPRLGDRQPSSNAIPESRSPAVSPSSATETLTISGAAQPIVSAIPLLRKGIHASASSNNPNAPSNSTASSWIPFGGNSSNNQASSNNRPFAPPPVPSRASSAGTISPALASEAVREGYHHLGMVAAEHLENMCDDLLRHHAPLLLNIIALGGQEESLRLKNHWINQLLTLATRCCATVEPNVRNGDLLDIRPYCKIKVIPGGSYRDCAYLSGVVFRKTVSHKRMAREIENPRIMLLSGGIEFTRTENRIASLETLFEQEDKYMEILVGKILKLKPDILMAGRFVRYVSMAGTQPAREGCILLTCICSFLPY